MDVGKSPSNPTLASGRRITRSRTGMSRWRKHNPVRSSRSQRNSSSVVLPASDYLTTNTSPLPTIPMGVIGMRCHLRSTTRKIGFVGIARRSPTRSRRISLGGHSRRRCSTGHPKLQGCSSARIPCQIEGQELQEDHLGTSHVDPGDSWSNAETFYPWDRFEGYPHGSPDI